MGPVTPVMSPRGVRGEGEPSMFISMFILALQDAYSHRLGHAFGSFRGFTGSRGSYPSRSKTMRHPIPDWSNPRFIMSAAGSWVPGQFGLVELFAMGVFEEGVIDLVGDAGGEICLRYRPN